MGKLAQTYLAALLLCVWQSSVPSVAAQQQQQQAPGAAAPGTDAPVDIQADEQEFAGDTVIAKGNVRVKYKDTNVYSPAATLYRTPEGQAQKAVFTGHPHLVQGESKMDADTLVFEIVEGNVIADGHAHSEVVTSGDDDDNKDGATADATAAGGAAADKDKEKASGKQIASAAKADKGDADKTDAGAGENKKKKKPDPKPTHATSPEMIITDSDHQEYAKEAGKFIANGHVHVKTADIVVQSQKLQLVYGTDGKPESAVFTGTVNATQFDNNTHADNMIYFLSTQRLQATGNVKSKVIQKKDEKKGGPANGPRTADGELDPSKLGDLPDDDIIYMNSDAQDYTKDTGRIAAQGNVRVKMGDIDGFGPNCVVVRNDEGQAEKVVFSGRSQINQPGRRWIGDRITMTVVDHKVLAEGNTRAIIVQQQPTKKPEQSPYARPATTPRPQNNNDGSKLADVINQSASSHDDGTQVAAKEPQQKQAEATQ